MKMADAEENTECSSKDSGDVRRARAPSKKKFDEEMDGLNNSIRKIEEQLEALKTAGPGKVAEELKNLKAEKYANIERRKKIDNDLQKLNKDITEMMHNISRLESSLHYRSEDKIDEAIRRLEWSLKVQNFKLSQEKKIVAEIDSLRRSKKTLTQYLSKKKDKDTMRDRQRRMREERDYYFHKVTELKQREEKLRSDNTMSRGKAEQLKKELDKLYESKRQMVALYKKQKDDFFDDREKRRHESFKKRMEEKQALQASLRMQREEFEAQKPPYDDNICLCNTLLHYLQRFISNIDLDSSSGGTSVSPPALPSPSDEAAPSGPAEELEDGQYVLLRKSEDDNYVSCSAKHAARKQRRSRKQSVVKRITHTPEVLAQFLQLNLNAPTTVAEILASIEQLSARKLYFEREAEVKSELSVTESAQCEVSRQASHTESSDGLCESRPSDSVVEQLLLSVSDHVCSPLEDPPSAAVPQANQDTAWWKQASSPASHNVDTDSAHSGSRSEDSSTPRSSLVAERGEEGVDPCACEETVHGSPANKDSGMVSTYSAVGSGKGCDHGNDMFYAKKAQQGHNPTDLNFCSDFGDKMVIDTDRSPHIAGQQNPTNDHGKLHICEGKVKGTGSLDPPSKGHLSQDILSSTSMTADRTDVSSLEEFPRLVRDGLCELGMGDSRDDIHHAHEAFFLQGKKLNMAESTQL